MCELRQGWLSPTGEFYECSSFDHIVLAKDLAEKQSVPDIDARSHRIIPDDERLMMAGWVYIGISSFRCHEWRIGWKRSITPEQIRFLRPYFEDGTFLPVNELSKQRWMEEIDDYG